MIIKQKYSNTYGQDQEKWDEIVKGMRSLGSIFDNHCMAASISDLEWRHYYFGNFVSKFLKIEYLRNWKNNLEPKFKRLLDDFYSVERGSCLAILVKHFNGGKVIDWKKKKPVEDFKSYMNRDPLLAFLWQSQDSISWEKCFDLTLTLSISYSNTEKEMKEFKSRKRQIFTLLFTSFYDDSLEFDLELVIENNHKIYFDIDKQDQYFLKIFKMLKIINQATWKNLLNIVIF